MQYFSRYKLFKIFKSNRLGCQVVYKADIERSQYGLCNDVSRDPLQSPCLQDICKPTRTISSSIYLL